MRRLFGCISPHFGRPSVLTLLGVICFLPVRTLAQWGRFPILDPKTYTSPSGEFSLFVNPHNSGGSTGATYRLSRNGRSLWSGDKPFALQDVGVADDGTVGAYAYTGSVKEAREGVFHVVILAPDGSMRLDKAITRTFNGYLHFPPNPQAEGLIMDAEHDRMVVRIADPEVNRSSEFWWVYRLSTGQPLKRFQPKALMGNPESARRVIDAKPIPETPLTLVHWFEITRSENSFDWGARFTLVDLDGRPVWKLRLPRDYSGPNDTEEREKLVDQIQKKGAILRSDQPRRFDLHVVAARQRVTYEVKPVSRGKWQVVEIGRSVYDPPARRTAASDPAIPTQKLTYLGLISLRTPDEPPPAAIRQVHEFITAGPHRFAFLRRDGSGQRTFVVVRDDGKTLHSIGLNDVLRSYGEVQPAYTWLGGERFLLACSSRRRGEHPMVWRIDAARNEIAAMGRIDIAEVDKLAAFADGSFVALSQYGSFTVRAFSAEGKPRWSIRDNYRGRRDDLISPADITITTDGKLALVDVIRHLVQLYSRNGKLLKTIGLKRAWRREPSYPDGIAADRYGGVVVLDYPANRPIVRMSASGTVRHTLRPRYRNGVAFTVYNTPRVDVDGRVWVSDLHSILRLANNGTVDKILGAPPTSERVGDIGALTIDQRGRIYALSERTAVVHVFDADGRWLHACKPTPKDVAATGSIDPRMTVDRKGDVYLWPAEPLGYVHFSSDGKRLGIEHIDEPPNTVEATTVHIQRRSDGKWSRGRDSVSEDSDGSIAILDGSLLVTDDDPLPAICFYTATGKAIGMFTLPASPKKPFQIAHQDGILIVAGEHDLIAFNRSGSPLWRFRPSPAESEVTYWQPFIPADRNQLYLYDGERTVYRYALTREPLSLK